MKDWLKKTLSHLWEGLMKNLGTALSVFLVSGGYLIAINKLGELQAWVRSIPTDYVLTPFVLLLVITFGLWRVNRKQKHELKKVEEQPKVADDESRLVTHYGVWWKLYPDSGYMEDFPYCPCCQPPRKLVQTEWYPDEKFKCPSTGTEIKLYDGIPWKLEEVRKRLYDAYFGPRGLDEPFFKELRRLKDLYPDRDEKDLLRTVLQAPPFDRLPQSEREILLTRFSKPHDLISFLMVNHRHYRRMLRGDSEAS